MPTDGPARRVLSLRLGISSIFDVTGAAIFRMIRPILPEPPPRGSRPDPFRAATDTIMAAHREVVVQAPGESEVAMQTPAKTKSKAAAQAPAKSKVALPAPHKTGVTLPA